MAKSAKKVQKIFGATGPTGSIQVFGSKKGGTPVYTDDVDLIQSTAAWTNGIGGALIDGTKPTLQDLNAILYTITYQNAYSQQRGIPAYHASEEYFIGSIVSDPSTSNGCALYCSIANNNIGNALTDNQKWQLLHSNMVRNIGATTRYIVVNSDWFLIWNISTVTSSSRLILPYASLSVGREIWIRHDNGSTAQDLIVTCSDDGQVIMNDSGNIVSCVVRYGNSVRLTCNGENWIASTKWGDSE